MRALVTASARPRSQREGRGHRRLAPRRDDAGYSIVEAVITLPVLLLLVMIVIQQTMVWHGRHVAEAAAQTGLRSGRAYQATAAAGQAAAEDYIRRVAPTLLTSPSVTAQRNAATVTVTVRAHIPAVLPIALLPGSSLDVTETAAGPVERFTAP